MVRGLLFGICGAREPHTCRLKLQSDGWSPETSTASASVSDPPEADASSSLHPLPGLEWRLPGVHQTWPVCQVVLLPRFGVVPCSREPAQACPPAQCVQRAKLSAQ
ncbi:photoreceptor disk component PRCD isoform X3 [Suricata suricatta]|uniref:photoreceptor disk component PRCD isoform X3 n=1 Tax=Suricata suricatta TaxID=37032 RepID=UPI001155CDAF|nr:photoreceptor disk component PRCD isoform X3 [Suricata suricatta]